MAKISKLAVAAPLTGRETFPLVQQDQTKAATIDQFVGQVIPHVQNYYKGDKGDPGSADNTYDDLTAFKASDVTRLAASLVDIDGVEDGRFYWTPGDFTGATDTNSLILSSSTPATQGAWLRRRDGEAVDLRNFGGSPVGQHTRNSAALAQALAASAPRAIIAADTVAAKDWYFSAAWPVAQMAGVEIDVDRACTLSHTADTIITGQGGMIRYARPTRHHFRAIHADYVSLPEGSLANDDKVSFLADHGPDHSRYVQVIVNDGRTLDPCKVAWPDGDAFVADPFSTSTDRLYRHAPARDGAFHLATKRIYPGQRYFAVPNVQSGNPLLVAIIRHSKGHIGVMADLNSPPSINFIEKTVGQPGRQTRLGFSDFPGATHASYLPRNSEWAIDIEDWRTGSVLFNGVLVHRFRTEGFIHRAGFGMFPTAEGDVVGWEDPNIGIDLPRASGQLFSALFMGDSRMMLRDGCPSHFAKKAMDLSFGVRTTRWDNAAIGGQDSAQQLAILNGIDLTVYNHVHIALGTNDVQGGVATPAQMIANLQAMAARARSQNCTVSFGIMPLWYGQGQAGAGRGQLSSNYERSAPFRAAIRRLCAENGYPVLDCSMLTGPILANFVNPALDPNLAGRGDPVVFDNIHLTALFNRIYGDAIAKLILGGLFAKRTLALGAQEIPGANGWSAGTEQPVMMIDEAGAVSCAGLIGNPAAASSSSGTVIGYLPPYACPSRTRRFVVVGSAGIGFVNVATDGAVSIYAGLVGSAWVDLSGIAFQLDTI